LSINTNKLIKLDTKITLISEEPQEQVLNILSSNLLLTQTNYNSGTLSLSSITSGSSGTSISELFELNSELLTSSCNTAFIFCDYPFDLQLNYSGEIHIDLYHFALSCSTNTFFSISIANRSEENDIVVRYLLAETDVLGSSYVYT
jgi:hypothetical protein